MKRVSDVIIFLIGMSILAGILIGVPALVLSSFAGSGSMVIVLTFVSWLAIGWVIYLNQKQEK